MGVLFVTTLLAIGRDPLNQVQAVFPGRSPERPGGDPGISAAEVGAGSGYRLNQTQWGFRQNDGSELQIKVAWRYGQWYCSYGVKLWESIGLRYPPESAFPDRSRVRVPGKNRLREPVQR